MNFPLKKKDLKKYDTEFSGYSENQKQALQARRTAADTTQKKHYEDKVIELGSKIENEADLKLKELFSAQKKHLEEVIEDFSKGI